MVTTRGYRVHVEDAARGASANCLVYVHKLGDQHRRGDFQLVLESTFDDSGISIPSHRLATFREQLRKERLAHDTFTGNEADDMAFIEGKMREAFGPGVTVAITFIEPAPRIGG